MVSAARPLHPVASPPLWVRPAVLAVTRLRRTAAWLLLPATLWLLLGVPGTLAKTVALMGLLASIGWLSAARRLRTAPPPCLLLTAEGLHLLPCPPTGAPPAPPPSKPPALRWTALEAVEVDEEALCIRLHRRDAPPLLLRPPWEQMGLQELAERIRLFAAASTATAGRG